MDVLRAHTETTSAYCRRRFESTHGEKRWGWERDTPNQHQHHTSHTKPTTLSQPLHTITTSHNTQHNTPTPLSPQANTPHIAHQHTNTTTSTHQHPTHRTPAHQHPCRYFSCSYSFQLFDLISFCTYSFLLLKCLLLQLYFSFSNSSSSAATGFPEFILHMYSVGGYTPCDGELEFPVSRSLCKSQTWNGVFVMFLTSSHRPLRVRLSEYCLQCNRKTTGSDGLGYTGSPYAALFTRE